MEVLLTLDQSATLEAVVSLSPQDISRLASREIPQEASFLWADRTLFKGNLTGLTHLDPHRLRLSYRDALFGAQKSHENIFFKQQTLGECLDKLTAKIGLQTRYIGNFGEQVPSLNLTGPSLLDHLTTLAQEFGFYFFIKSTSGQICFLKVGSYVKDVETTSQSQVTNVSYGQSADHYYSQVNFKYLDQHSLESKEKRMGANDLYSPLSNFKDHSSYRDKTTWKNAKGSYEAHVNENYHFESGEQLLKNQLSKKLMEQESIKLSVFEPVGLPGDRIKIKNGAVSTQHEGNYLIKSCKITAAGSAPRMDMEAIRP